ncbi:cell surface protein SprA [Flavobacterium gawalongense]|uniref:Cell surface protein SprA n=1 Tax=Flavobacterium gawalongense TaxID=2594432 RepID=A0ABY3CPT9_9FLAO|nr:cell surface protein SprA [Flavobacterium gawalongense]TRX04222.1 cell surface protein SprA [Flavobacterium gawalongense]TRX09328.1 cell surface protein SprA [Flavobacterium gawalongense]TRX13203.1 cell surface protein SprA [Flavobacterium gawalongense]TRX30735.1 cell surface protein SprA [Flavobacterium gawalongense]
MHKICIFLLVIFCGFVSQAQGTPAVQDTIVTGFSTGKVQLKDPQSVLSAYTYDPVTDRYIYTNSVDGFSINYPIILTPKEYESLVLKESMRDYFKKKVDAIDGKKEGSEAAKKDLLPRYYVKSGLFESIFGSNTIDVKPTGSIELDLGMRYTKQDNPSFSPRNRSNLSFDFDQRISMSLIGKVGTRLNVNANYDTQSTFAFQNLMKLEYAPSEDDIIQKIEVGNVSMPLNSSLIRGAQSLFGVKTQLQFGKTTVTGIFSEQKSQTKSLIAQGGGTIQDFDMYALDYDNDRHFFLSQYFRNKYDASLKNYPFIDSRVQISRLEIWVTNKQNRVNTTNNNLRNIIALQDLGEGQLTGLADNEVVVLDPIPGDFFKDQMKDYPSDNSNNRYDPKLIDNGGLLNNNIREIVTSSSGFTGVTVNEGQDYSKLENARKLNPNEYTFNSQLGYISLQQRLANDEVLAVAYQYTIGDKVYQVGEFGNDGVDATVVTGTNQSNQAIITQSLILKMLKSNLTNVKNPVWNLMMKNIYQIPGAYQVKQEDFRFNILYTDPSPLNYINIVAPLPQPEDLVTSTPLLKVFNLDKLNYNNDPQAGGDGFFDFMQGLTIDAQNGRIIFTTKEPFGELLFEKLRSDQTERYNGDPIADYNENQKKYVFRNMYRNTQSGALQDSEKNKFLLRGKYKSTGGDGIPIGAFNVPRGSVVVTAGGRVLVEGVDYSVNYQLGRVQILDPSLQASNTPIEVSLENNSIFGQQTRRFMGVNVEHKISDNFLVGATFLKMTEKPFTQKSSFGQESVNNTIFGFNSNFSTEVPFLTRLVNKLPNLDTDVPSNLSVRGEIAFLKPDSPKADRFEGESTIYVDDFEGSQSTIDMRSPYSWSLSSTPEKNARSTYDFNASANDLSYGFKRAKLAWYSIDPVFYTQKPSGISNEELSFNTTRRIFSEELYPLTDIAQGQSQVVNTLDLSYYPSDRGPYNNSSNVSTNPTDNFGGIMRSLNSTNFEQGNVEYIQFWILDPYVGSGEIPQSNTGKIYFNLGEVSEDVLKDGKKQYENGLGPDQIISKPNPGTANWGDVPASQSLIYAFDTNADNRTNQDVGLDGLANAKEGAIYNNFASESDPAADDYTYYLNASGNVLDRYKKYNGVDGNSAVDINDPNRGASTVPDVEDINRDNTMNTINAYYEYSIDVKPNMSIGQNYITDIRSTQVTLANGAITDARWIQFKIPVSQPENTIGNISDFRSIRFMRMFMTGFNDRVTVRFGALDLVRGEWRRYANTLDFNDTNIADDKTTLDVLAVNVQENNERCPVNYITPPGVVREQLYNNNTVINQNEQSLSLRVSGDGLEPEDSRAVFKNVNIDMRQFKKLKMFLHAESLPNEIALRDNQMVGFIRFGNDFTQNFYQIEIPLKVTVPSSGSSSDCAALSAEAVWPEDNEIDLSLALLTKLKILAMSIDPSTLPLDGIYYQNEEELDPSLANKNNKLRLGIKGNPNFGLARTLMVGVKSNETHQDIKGEVWFNELRLADMDNQGGMAAVLNVDSNFADFATVSATGKKSTIGFGALEEGPNERNREDTKQYNIVTNVNLGKLLPPKWGVNLPFNYAIGEETITPEYDPFNQDIKLKQLLDNTTDQAEKDNIERRAIDYTKRQSINFIGVRKERSPEQKQRVYDPENFTFSQSFNQVERHDFEIEDYVDQQANSSIDYAYSFQPKPVEPFKKTAFMKKSDYWKLLSDFNFNYLPSNISFNTNIIRQYNRQQFRQVDVEGIGLDPLYRRNFAFNYQYGFNYNLTKSLKLNYTASSSNIVKSYLNENNEPIDSFTIWDSYWDMGDPNQHMQQLVVNYEIPINKIPLFSFIKANYSYTGDYSWQRASNALSQIEIEGNSYNLGNTVQNASSNNLNATFNMDALYKYLGLTKNTNKSAPKPKAAAPKPGEKVVNTNTQQIAKSNEFVDGLRGILTSIKNVQMNYTENSGTILPGYTPGVGFLGSSRPSLGFIFGSQDDVRYETAKNGWLTNYPDFNQNYSQVTNRLFKATANVDLLPDLKIDLSLDRAYSKNFSEQYDVTNGEYNPRSPYSYGLFSISTVLIKTSFSTSDENASAAFDDLKTNRLMIADRLAQNFYGGSIPRYGDAANPIPTDPSDPKYTQRDIYLTNEGYPIGFGKNSQAVLLPAFLSAYSGTNASDVSLGIFRSFPIPNWAVKYNGLMRFAFFKKNFKRFSMQHSYRASYTINAFRSNFEYDKAPSGYKPNGELNTDLGGNIFNKTIMSNINLVEQFSPLIRMDFELKSSLKVLTEIKKDRALSMSFDNNLLTEVKGIEYVVGLGYRFKDVIFSSRLADNPTGIIKSDINLKGDLSYRNNQTIVRYLDYDNNQLAGGQNIWSLKITADYAFSKNLTAIFYYDHSFSKAVISTSFPLTNIRSGFTLRYNFGN